MPAYLFIFLDEAPKLISPHFLQDAKNHVENGEAYLIRVDGDEISEYSPDGLWVPVLEGENDE